MSTIALITDFGTHDWFVGSMKGVILGINPAVSIVDISHHIPPGDIRAAAFSLLACYRSFSKGTIFVAVVDPGVGSTRKSIVAETEDYMFVGPDNGVFSFVLRDSKQVTVYQIEKKDYFRKPVSSTFHGRDIFAPVGAYLTTGVSPSEVGKGEKQWITLDWPEVKITEKAITGEVIYVDHFGNAFTSITTQSLSNFSIESCCVRIGEEEVPLCRYYNEVPEGEACALVNSAGFVEIAINGGNAAQKYNLSLGTTVNVVYSKKQ